MATSLTVDFEAGPNFVKTKRADGTFAEEAFGNVEQHGDLVIVAAAKEYESNGTTSGTVTVTAG